MPQPRKLQVRTHNGDVFLIRDVHTFLLGAYHGDTGVLVRFMDACREPLLIGDVTWMQVFDSAAQ